MADEQVELTGRELFDPRWFAQPKSIVTHHRCDHCQVVSTRYASEYAPPSAEGELCGFCRQGHLSRV